jgi:hypothetical protein
MRCLLSIFVVLASCVVSAGQDGKAVKSGPQEGNVLPGAFDALNVSGKVAAGRQHCLVCQNGLNAAVLIFAREPKDKDKDGALTELMKKVDALAAKHSDKTLGSFVVFLSPHARSSVLNAVEGDVDKLFEEAKARNDLVARLKTRSEGLDHTVVAAYPSEGPKGYDVDPKADVTVIFYHRLKVLDNWAFEAGKMTEADASAIVKQIDAKLQEGKDKPKKRAA